MYGLQRGESQRCPPKRHARWPAQEIKGIDGRLRHSINDVTERGAPSLRIYRYRQAGAGYGATHSQEGRSGEGARPGEDTTLQAVRFSQGVGMGP